MRVLFITRKWPPAVGGMETYSFELVQELRKLCDIQVAGLAGKTNGAPPSPLQLIAFVFKTTAQVVFKKRQDVYHVGDMVLWPIALAAKIFHPRSKIVATAHGLDLLYGYRSGLVPSIYKSFINLGSTLLGKSLVVVTNSNATAEIAKDSGFKKVTAVPLATNHEIKPLNSASSTKPFVLFVGRLVKRKGAGWFAQNVMPLLPANIDFKVAGPTWDKAEELALKDGTRTEYLGLVDAKDLTKLRQQAIAVVMPNISLGVKDFEGFGLTAPEAAAEGGVLIASAIEGITDAVLDAKTGFLIEAENPKAWAAKILEISKWSKPARLKFVSAAQEQVTSHFSWQRVAAETLKAYQK